MNKKTEKFNPDRLTLSKDDILDFCDRVLEKWGKEPDTHSQNIIAMNAVRASVYWTDEESLKAIWGEILKWTFELMYKNALAQAKQEKAPWSPVLEKLEKKETALRADPYKWF